MNGTAEGISKAWITRRKRYGANGTKNGLPANPAKDPSERLWKHIITEPNTGCWLWNASLDSKGYGAFRVNGSLKKAHRFSFELKNGPVPEGMVLDHICRVRCCVNPDHLEIVTNAENIRRGNVGENMRSKTHCPQGHPYAGDNVYMSGGSRMCRTCNRIRSANWKERTAYVTPRRTRSV